MVNQLPAPLDPKIRRRFVRACATLRQIVEDTRIAYPEAMLFAWNNSFCLVSEHPAKAAERRYGDRQGAILVAISLPLDGGDP